MKCSIIVPAHNEAAVLEGFVTAFLEALPDALRALLAELIIVENGSRDDTLAVAQRLAARFPLVRVIANDRPSYGAAIRRGMLEARGTHLCILECDALDVDFTRRAVALLARGAARFIVASKRHPGSRDRRPWLRRQLTAWYNRMLRLASGYPGSDTHGHKAMETQLARRLCELAITSDESFQTEIVMIAWKLGETITELPISIAETRQPGISLLNRLPMVVASVAQLRGSLARFPARTGPADSIRVAPGDLPL
jgi:glycosyltransferase involved in cell wall biosynthesis